MFSTVTTQKLKKGSQGKVVNIEKLLFLLIMIFFDDFFSLFQISRENEIFFLVKEKNWKVREKNFKNLKENFL